MPQPPLDALEHENFIAAIGLIASTDPDGVVRRFGSAIAIGSTVPMRLFNQVMVEGVVADRDAAPVVGPRGDADDLLAAVDLMRSRDRGFLVHLRDGLDDALGPALERAGLRSDPADGLLPGMAVHPLPGPEPVPDGLEIRTATSPELLDDHAIAAAGGFGMPLELARMFLRPPILDVDAATFYVGYVDGVPVTTSMGLRTGRTIGVYNVATVESARGRGFGRTMTLRALIDGAAAGCDVGILQASDMGRPVYERLGFRTVVGYRAWTDPA